MVLALEERGQDPHSVRRREQMHEQEVVAVSPDAAGG